MILSFLWPSTVFFNLLLFSEDSIPLLLFFGFLLDKFFYDFPFLNTLLMIVFLVFRKVFYKRDTLVASFLFIWFVTFLYYGFWSLYFQKIILGPFLVSFVWNSLFVLLCYHRKRITVHIKS